MDEYIDIDLVTLVEYAQKGDEAAFTKICDQFRPLYFAQWVKFRNLKIEKDDWLQEMQIITFKCVQTFKPRQFNRSFGSYLRCAINFRCIDEWRRQRAKNNFEDPRYALPGMIDDRMAKYNNAQDLLIVREAVQRFISSRVSKKERATLKELVTFSQVIDAQYYTPAEIVAKQRRFMRTRAQLRKKLEELLE